MQEVEPQPSAAQLVARAPLTAAVVGRPTRLLLPAAEPEPERHPHPITAQHRIIQRELQLVGALNDALDLADAHALRELIALHAREYPSDENALRAGFARIADCLEEPGERTRAAARDYYTRERASTLRRYVRRVCLEAQD